MSDKPRSEQSDREIIESFKAGDRDIYTELIARHYSKAYQIAFGILRQNEDAEEVVQDSFVKMHKVLDDFRGDSQFTTWMYRIVTNYAKNKYRWNKRRGAKQNVSMNAPVDGIEGSTLVLDLPGKEMDPQGGSEFNELEKGVYRHLKDISPLYREVLILRNLDGLSYDEIASILDCKIGTVKSRIARGRDELRRRLKQEDLI